MRFDALTTHVVVPQDSMDSMHFTLVCLNFTFHPFSMQTSEIIEVLSKENWLGRMVKEAEADENGDYQVPDFPFVGELILEGRSVEVDSWRKSFLSSTRGSSST